MELARKPLGMTEADACKLLEIESNDGEKVMHSTAVFWEPAGFKSHAASCGRQQSKI